MRRRTSPRRRDELRRAAIARLGIDFRTLASAAALATAGEPEHVADAIERTYNAIQQLHPKTAYRMYPYEIRRLTDGSFELAVQLALMNLDVQRPAVLEHRCELREQFTAEVRAHWDEPLDELRLLHEVAFEAGATFNGAAQTATAAHHALARLHARGLAITAEILCLLEHGFASGAMARWRTLHEATVIAVVVSGGGERLAKRYLDHEIVSRWRQAQDYQRLAAGTGETPLDDDELDRIRDDYEAALVRFGPAYRHDYGWANGRDEKRRLTFRDLEELAGHGELRSYYQMANQPVHAGSRGLLWEIGAVADHVLVAGSSDRGLADPGQLTAFSLARLTRTFVLSRAEFGLRWVIYSDAVDALAHRATRAFFRAHVATDAEPGFLGSVSAGRRRRTLTPRMANARAGRSRAHFSRRGARAPPAASPALDLSI